MNKKNILIVKYKINIDFSVHNFMVQTFSEILHGEHIIYIHNDNEVVEVFIINTNKNEDYYKKVLVRYTKEVKLFQIC